MTSEQIRKIADKCQIGIKGGRHGIASETEVVLPEIPLFDRMEISNALYSYSNVVERYEESIKALSDMQENAEHLDLDTVMDVVEYIMFGASAKQGKDKSNG